MKTHVEIKAQNLIHNLKLFNRISQKNIMFVVKANAYGHGIKEIVQISQKLPFIEYYAVDSLSEALMVRSISRKNILVIGWADPSELSELIGNGFEMVIPSLDYLKRVRAIARRNQTEALVHLKLDSGASRLGMESAEILKIFNESGQKGIRIKGVYSHFANIEDTTDHSFAHRQLQMYNRLMAKLKARNFLRHFSCSASTLLFPETHFDLVRVGISAYGYWPSKQTYLSYIEKNKKQIKLEMVLHWATRVAQVRTIEKGRYIGYGLTYQAFGKSKMIVIPVGYYDGYDRKLSNISNVLVNSFRAPVRGRVCMNMMMAEVTHIRNVRDGDRVLLLGSENGNRIDADYLGDLTNTINYEILSRINPMIPRVVVL